jgi:hypothetical protein
MNRLTLSAFLFGVYVGGFVVIGRALLDARRAEFELPLPQRIFALILWPVLLCAEQFRRAWWRKQ